MIPKISLFHTLAGVSEVRFWHRDEFLGNQKVKNSELNLVHF